MGTRTLLKLALAGAATIGLVAGTPGSGAAGPGATGPAPAAPTASVAIVQAVPGVDMTVVVDGEEVGDVVAGAVLSPLDLTPGEHEMEFRFGEGSVAATISVAAGRMSDVVVHQPAEVGGDPVVSVYPTPTDPIGPGKARVVLAHTATTAPADVEVDDQVVFTNIANGEYAEADVAAGRHRVALLPSGVDAPPILGPLEVTLDPGTLTSVYAVGNPRTRSMDVIVRETRLRGDGSKPPMRVETGSAGLVAGLRMPTFVVGG